MSESETSTPQLILESASPCKILLANHAWCQLTGYASEDVVGHSISLLHGPLTCRETLTSLGLAMAAGQSLHVMLVCYSKSSHPCLCSISSIPLLDGAGMPTFFQWAITGYIMLGRDAQLPAAPTPVLTSRSCNGQGTSATVPGAVIPAIQHLSGCNANLFTSHQTESGCSVPPYSWQGSAPSECSAGDIQGMASRLTGGASGSRLALGAVEAAGQLSSAKRPCSTVSELRPKRSRGGGQPSRPAPFVRKLYDMVSSPETDALIGWAEEGRSFWIRDPDALETLLLPRVFKHNRIAFFTKQLKSYGFKQRLGPSILSVAKEWYHEGGRFVRGDESKLDTILRSGSANARAAAVDTAVESKSAKGSAGVASLAQAADGKGASSGAQIDAGMPGHGKESGGSDSGSNSGRKGGSDSGSSGGSGSKGGRSGYEASCSAGQGSDTDSNSGGQGAATTSTAAGTESSAAAGPTVAATTAQGSSADSSNGSDCGSGDGGEAGDGDKNSEQSTGSWPENGSDEDANSNAIASESNADEVNSNDGSNDDGSNDGSNEGSNIDSNDGSNADSNPDSNPDSSSSDPNSTASATTVAKQEAPSSDSSNSDHGSYTYSRLHVEITQLSARLEEQRAAMQTQNTMVMSQIDQILQRLG